MHGLFAMALLFAADEKPGGGGLSQLLPPLIIIFILFWFMIIRPQKKKEQNFKTMVANLKKNDRVVTIGGIHGTVANVQREIDRITLRIDETTGTTIRVGTGAIARIITEEDKSSDK
ncbi:MAG: preprotein translocase subunit YajC [Pirellulales bacterium]|nr:preprotein translocase subunit YajC [Pirellulales bacterium]